MLPQVNLPAQQQQADALAAQGGDQQQRGRHRGCLLENVLLSLRAASAKVKMACSAHTHDRQQLVKSLISFVRTQ
jgi:hypothetical protein